MNLSREERRKLRQQKVLQRKNLSDMELSQAIISGNIKETIEKAKENNETEQKPLLNPISKEESRDDVTTPKFQVVQKNKKKVLTTKFFLFTMLGVASSIFTVHHEFDLHPNVFILFLLMSFTFNFFYFKRGASIDKNEFDKRLGSFITAMEKVSYVFQAFDDLACYFVSFIVTGNIINFVK